MECTRSLVKREKLHAPAIALENGKSRCLCPRFKGHLPCVNWPHALPFPWVVLGICHASHAVTCPRSQGADTRIRTRDCSLQQSLKYNQQPALPSQRKPFFFFPDVQYNIQSRTWFITIYSPSPCRCGLLSHRPKNLILWDHLHYPYTVKRTHSPISNLNI